VYGGIAMIKLSIFGAFLFLSGCHFLSPHPPTPEERAKQFVDCFRREFNPTDEQLNTLKEKILKATEEDKQNAKELRVATEHLETGLESSTSETDLIAAFSKVKELKNRMSESHFLKMLALRSVLTAEQRSQFLVCKRKMGAPVLPHEG
jgi:uncharacterized protein YecT (DUF1311 family)